MKIIMTLLATGALALAPGAAMAVPPQTSSPPQSGSLFPSHVTGQPDQSCEDLGNRPGQSIDSPGSAFSPTGTSGGKYAGQQTGINDKNTAASSQYDVACLHNQRPD